MVSLSYFLLQNRRLPVFFFYVESTCYVFGDLLGSATKVSMQEWLAETTIGCNRQFATDTNPTTHRPTTWIGTERNSLR